MKYVQSPLVWISEPDRLHSKSPCSLYKHYCKTVFATTSFLLPFWKLRTLWSLWDLVSLRSLRASWMLSGSFWTLLQNKYGIHWRTIWRDISLSCRHNLYPNSKRRNHNPVFCPDVCGFQDTSWSPVFCQNSREILWLKLERIKSITVFFIALVKYKMQFYVVYND